MPAEAACDVAAPLMIDMFRRAINQEVPPETRAVTTTAAIIVLELDGMESVAEVEFIALSVAGDSARKELDGWTATAGQVQRHLKSFRRRTAGAAFYFSCGGLECPWLGRAAMGSILWWK